jgi:hypothetical protein
MTTAEDLAVST